MLRKFSLTGASCLSKKSFLLRHFLPLRTSSYHLLYKSYGSGLRFAPKFPFPNPSATRFQYVVKPRPSVLIQMTKALKTEPPFGAVRSSERGHRKTPSKKNVSKRKSDKLPVVSNDEALKKKYVAFLKDDGDDDEDDSDDNNGNINAALWEKAIKANKEWEEKQKIDKSSEQGYQKRQQEQQVNGRKQVALDESHDNDDDESQSNKLRKNQLESIVQKKVRNEIKLKLAETSLRDKKLDERIDRNVRRTIDPKEFMVNFQKQEKSVKNQERLQNLMQLQQQQLDGEVPSQCERELWKKVLPSDLGRHHFSETRYMSHRGQCLEEIRNLKKLSCDKRRDFTYPAYTPFNANSDNADYRAQSQKKNSFEKPEHVSATCALHRDRAAEMEIERAAQGSVKESAIYRLCNFKSSRNSPMEKSLKFNPWGKKQF